MVTSNAATGYVAKISMLRLNICLGPRWAKSGWSPDAGWTGMPDGPDGYTDGQIRMESGWAGMPDGPDGVYRMGPGWLPTAQIS